MIRGVRPHQSGFTILETVIVLAVTMGLMATAYTLISGKVPRTQFAASVNELEEKLRTTSNDVTNGFYPNTSSAACTTSGFDNTTTIDQGTNQDCIFLGKAVQFGVQEAGCTPVPDDKCDTVKIYTIFGHRVNSGTLKVATNLREAEPDISHAANNGNSAPETYKIGYGTYVTKIKSGAAGNVGGVAYTQTFGSSVVGGEPSGSPQVQLIPLKTGLALDETNFVTNSTSELRNPATIPNPAEGVEICLRSAGSNQYAIITVGEAQRTNGTKIEIFDNDTVWGPRCS